MNKKGAPAPIQKGEKKARGRGEMKSKRQLAREQRIRRRQYGLSAVILVGVVALGGIVYALSVRAQEEPAAVQGAIEREVTIMADTSHYPEGQAMPAHNSNPPTSGPHYASTYPVGFYTEEQAANLPQLPEGFLVHNLEHGYVIFWYNCALVEDEESCANLQGEIQEVMEQADNFKVIGFPWPSLEKPVVMTSWGRMIEFSSFDPDRALAFVQQNRNKAPEPNAP
jgi:hypothetical protein